MKSKAKKQQKKKQKFLDLFVVSVLVLFGIVLIYFTVYFFIQTLSKRTDLQNYKSALNEAVLEASMVKPLFQELDNNGCAVGLFTRKQGCNMNALLYFSDPAKQPLFEKHLEQAGWQNKTIKDTMLPDAD